MQDTFLIIVVSISLIAIVFMVLRGLFCWYYKIDDRLAAQRRTNMLLEEILNRLNERKSDDSNSNHAAN